MDGANGSASSELTGAGAGEGAEESTPSVSQSIEATMLFVGARTVPSGRGRVWP